MNPEELSQRLEKIEKQLGYALGNQLSIIELQENLNKRIADTSKYSGKMPEFMTVANFFLLSIVLYGLFYN